MAAPRFFNSSQAFRHWLQANAATAEALVVGFHKVGSGRPSMRWSDSVDEALCFGWIDGVRKRIDDQSYQIRFSRRRATSIWSAINTAKIETLRQQGRMTPAGELAFARRTEAKSVVYAYEQAGDAELSAVQIRAFQREKAAWRYFQNAPPSYRKVMLHWVAGAKKAQTRASRFATLVEACIAGQRLR